jgi:glutamate dehydrogenase/leucine dehydrogenase
VRRARPGRAAGRDRRGPRAPWAVVAPAANVPYAEGAIDVLHERGILAVPDFVANAGAVHLYTTVDGDASPAAALEAIEDAIRAAVGRTLSRADEDASTPYAAALRDGRDWFAAQTSAPPEALDALF